MKQFSLAVQTLSITARHHSRSVVTPGPCTFIPAHTPLTEGLGFLPESLPKFVHLLFSLSAYFVLILF